MTSFRASRSVVLALAAGLPILLTAVAAPAQSATGQPMPLGPPGPSAPPTVSQDEPPPAFLKVVPSPLLETPPRPPAAGGRFEMEELRAPDIEAVGVLDDKQGGLGAGLWHGTSATLVRRLLVQLPATPGSRTMRSLERRLLLTAAAAPEDGKGITPPLLELRAERLLALGEIEGLAALLKAAPAALTSPGLSRLKIDTFLLAGDAKAACAEAATAAQTGAGSSDPRMPVFCMLTAGKTLEANMALDLMRERKDADHAFIAAAEAMAGTPPARVDRLPNPTPLHLAAFKAAKMALPADAAHSAPPAMLRAMIDSPGLAIETRLLAAERAEALGAMDTDSLRRFYGAVTFTPAEQQAALVQSDKTPRGRVLLLRGAGGEPTPSIRAELISRILTAAAERGAFGGTARLYAPVIAELKPSPELAPTAAMLARALFAAGRPEAAGTWVALAKSNPATTKAAADLWPLTRLGRSGSAESISAEAYAVWLGARELSADQAERRAVMALEMLQAVGDKVPNPVWLAVPQGPGPAAVPGAPKPALKAMLRAAAEGLRSGETLLLALVALGETTLDKADPDTVNRVVVFLRMIGLDREARDLAVEAALANGV
ncbi:MAG: antifreeze protein [Magnetospirillum sp.]|nr:MAG: antifreeze protein [Magnetospirillum sp.]